jgi:translocation and assembly module TamA
VRGYAYQAIGPKDRYGDPMGGRSFQDVNFEMRFRVSESIGIVPFVDGGMVYSDEYPELFSDFQWAAGLGLRYYTPIGPIRLDVAVPLDKKDDDSDYQFYISIGQAF